MEGRFRGPVDTPNGGVSDQLDRGRWAADAVAGVRRGAPDRKAVPK
ncbi:hypothetical protein tb265_22160 [Gemmatimonadetes bacterium T265]|nr:hypothetical protein tb265_22160 [Gemmatimonadetes bacterium T265]